MGGPRSGFSEILTVKKELATINGSVSAIQAHVVDESFGQMKQIGHLWVDDSVIVVPAVSSIFAVLQPNMVQ